LIFPFTSGWAAFGLAFGLFDRLTVSAVGPDMHLLATAFAHLIEPCEAGLDARGEPAWRVSSSVSMLVVPE
jgi:hypothetical protein